jgi:hypothetical protein
MKLTVHEIMLIAVVLSALIVGAVVRQYRNAHPALKPLPAVFPAR